MHSGLTPRHWLHCTFSAQISAAKHAFMRESGPCRTPYISAVSRKLRPATSNAWFICSCASSSVFCGSPNAECLQYQVPLYGEVPSVAMKCYICKCAVAAFANLLDPSLMHQRFGLPPCCDAHLISPCHRPEAALCNQNHEHIDAASIHVARRAHAFALIIRRHAACAAAAVAEGAADSLLTSRSLSPSFTRSAALPALVIRFRLLLLLAAGCLDACCTWQPLKGAREELRSLLLACMIKFEPVESE